MRLTTAVAVGVGAYYLVPHWQEAGQKLAAVLAALEALNLATR